MLFILLVANTLGTLFFKTLKTWDDTTEAEAYLENFEAIMREADIPEIDWPSTLRKQLAGRALSIFRELSPTEETSYQRLKKDLIERLGTTLQQTRCAIWLDDLSQTKIHAVFYSRPAKHSIR